jgi:hypothetical protein
MYTDYKQLFTQNTNNITPTAAQQKAYADGLALRDLKWAYITTLLKRLDRRYTLFAQRILRNRRIFYTMNCNYSFISN